MTDTGGVENHPQPAIRRAPPTRQPPQQPPRPGPAPGAAPKQGDWKTFVESVTQLLDRIASIRQIRWIRRSSAAVRWALLVLAVGLGSALLVALTISLLTTLIPRSG
jgi:hypothetical protein